MGTHHLFKIAFVMALCSQFNAQGFAQFAQVVKKGKNAIPGPVRAFLGPLCKANPIRTYKQKPANLTECAKTQITYSCQVNKERSLSVTAVVGSFSSKEFEEALLAVEDSDVPHAEGGGYYALARKTGKKWKIVARGQQASKFALPPYGGNTSFVSKVTKKDGTDSLILCSYDCWQGCCTGGCEVLSATQERGFENLPLFSIGEQWGWNSDKPIRTIRCTSFKNIGAHRSEVKEFVFKLELKEKGKIRNLKLKFLFDGRKFWPAPKNPKIDDISC